MIAVVRGDRHLSGPISTVRIESFSAQTQWHAHLANIDTVIHCAARVHVMNDTEADPLAAFRQVNVEGTLNFARQAAEAGVRRFIFISSIKVNGKVRRPANLTQPTIFLRQWTRMACPSRRLSKVCGRLRRRQEWKWSSSGLSWCTGLA